MTIKNVKPTYQVGDLVGLLEHRESDFVVEFGSVVRYGGDKIRISWDDGYDSGKFLESEWDLVVGRNTSRWPGPAWVEHGILTEHEVLVWKLKYPDHALQNEIGDLD